MLVFWGSVPARKNQSTRVATKQTSKYHEMSIILSRREVQSDANREVVSPKWCLDNACLFWSTDNNHCHCTINWRYLRLSNQRKQYLPQPDALLPALLRSRRGRQARDPIRKEQPTSEPTCAASCPETDEGSGVGLWFRLAKSKRWDRSEPRSNFFY